ncbi:hypothetical protein REC_24 [Pseudomonas phage REC]|nr:hypothetical protein REC_24 [Pseudomonas phage REC]UGL62620.1 hypothetical protein [Pseudomonas phage REC1]
MEWLFAFFALCAVGAMLEDVHTKYHERQMAKAKHYKELIYT